MRSLFISTFLLIVALQAAPSFSDEGENPEQFRVTQLENIFEDLEGLRARIASAREQLASTDIISERRRLSDQIQQLEEKLVTTEQNFVNTATDIQISEPREGEARNRDLASEVRELLAPVLDSIRRISARPRKIERLKNQIARYDERLELVAQARSNLDSISAHPEAKRFVKELEVARRKLADTEYELRSKKEARQRVLKQELGQSRPMLDEARDLFQKFINTKGKNLFIALLTFLVTIVGSMMLRKWVFRPEHFPDRISWLKKPLSAVYSAFSLVLGLGISITVLFLLHDLVLATLFGLVLVGFAWSARNYLPKFFDELRYVLNLGTIREGERIIWDGIPWRIERLGMSSILENPELEGGRLVVKIRQLMDFVSRPASPGEPWFPTRKGDWVLFDDQTYGKVQIQTPEQVVLTLAGGTRKFYKTVDFISARPQNLSDGYQVRLTFRVDRKMQNRVLQEIPRMLEAAVRTKLSSDEHTWFKNLVVRFKEPSEYAFHVEVVADCTPAAAEFRREVMTEINHAVMAALNEASLETPLPRFAIEGSI